MASRPLTERIDLLTSFVTHASLKTSALFGFSSTCSEKPYLMNSSSLFDANEQAESLSSWQDLMRLVNDNIKFNGYYN